MIKWRFRTRLRLWFALSLLLILTPMLAGVLWLQWRAMRDALDHHLREDLEVAAQMLVWDDGTVRWRTETDHDVGYDSGRQRWVEVYTTDGAGLFFRGRAADVAIRAAMLSPSPQQRGFYTRRTPAGAHVRVLTAERTVDDMPLVLRVVRSEDALRTDFRNLALLFATLAPLAIAGAALAGYAIAERALAPLSRMAARARTISADHLSERLPVETDDELGQLARVFNDTFARLESSFQQLMQFSADVSHELRTPLTAIRSVGEVALRESRDEAGYQESIGSMLEEADRLARVVDTLLMLARWESGRIRPKAEALSLRDVAREVAGQLSVLAEERDIKLEVTIADPLLVWSDPVMARQAIVNVIDNAIKYTRAGSRVTVSASGNTSEHAVVVDDEGPGIPSEQRDRVLERFFRIDGGLDRQSGGTGLGLAIVHRALAVNGGRISIDANPCGGARVTLWLPRHQTNPNA